MKIELELPDWVEDKHLFVMAGIEVVAYKHLGEPWKIKTGRCNYCGKCCMNFDENDSSFKDQVVDGHCIHLVNYGEQWVCDLGSARPWDCSTVIRPQNIPECTEEYK